MLEFSAPAILGRSNFLKSPDPGTLLTMKKYITYHAKFKILVDNLLYYQLVRVSSLNHVVLPPVHIGLQSVTGDSGGTTCRRLAT